MYMDEIYRAIVEVTNPIKRQKLTFIKQTLYLYNSDDNFVLREYRI
jgi:hypothetical protein